MRTTADMALKGLLAVFQYENLLEQWLEHLAFVF